MTRGPEAPEFIQRLPLYIPGKPIDEVRRELGLKGEISKLASNENPFGTSPKALAAIKTAITDLNLYPDGGGFYLRKELATRRGVEIDQIILGNGSTEIIEMLAKAYLEDGDEAVLSQQSFVMYPIAIAAVNGKPVMVPATKERCHDVEAMAAAVTEKTKLIYIANPSNPTGTYINRKQMDRLFELVPDSVLVVVDQAYHEYLDRDDYPDTLEDLKAGRNVIVLRTFSKIYGLAGLRIGYGVTDAKVVETINHVRSPFNTSNVAQAAGLAALDDNEWAEKCSRLNSQELLFLEAELSRRNARFTHSVANFVLVEFDRDVKELFVEFQKRGVIIRPVGGPGLVNCMRVSVGTHEENERFLAAYDELI